MVKTKKPSPQTLQQLRQYSGEMPLKEKKENVFQGAEEDQTATRQQDLELAQLKAEKTAWAQKRIQEIEQEVKALGEKREQEVRQRYQQGESEEKQKEVQEEQMKRAQVPEVATKPKKGLPFWGRRIKTAQQQAQPETAGRRTGG